tara:strand:- start:709 stop:1053 length:345 start_codon:yes stop_codon:yes gene_type:complete
MNTVDEKVSIANLRYQYYENNGGMFVSHTAREWLIGYTDPIVAYADPEDDFICYQCVTSETYRIYTGHGNGMVVTSLVGCVLYNHCKRISNVMSVTLVSLPSKRCAMGIRVGRV